MMYEKNVYRTWNTSNAQLKGKIKLLTTEMKDAVERMNSMTLEMNTIRNDNLFHKGN